MKTTQWEQTLQTISENEKPVVNLMVDFETFGVNPENCGIMSAAVVSFSVFGEEDSEQVLIHKMASIESNWMDRRDVSTSQEWWTDARRSSALSHYLECVNTDPENSVEQLEQAVIEQINAFAENEDINVLLWSRGNFDIVILRRIFRRNEIEFPIPYYNIRDARTFIMEHHIDESLFVEPNETEHVALYDCRRCIREIQYINRTLRDCGFYSAVDAITSDENHRRMKALKEEL